ncbi:MAG: PBP1A family penicillin-binding protein [Spirochaetaceae bacterium]|nr:PBP1A family penicillin-binding protein [Spirochaetaceae bacterium]
MVFNRKQKILLEIFLSFAAIITIIFGIAFGILFALSKNITETNRIGEYRPALPSQVLDINGNLITQFFSEEKREIIPIDEIPKHLIQALITREDREFFQHNGFSIRGTIRAAWNIVRGRYISGGSTITQQVAGRQFADRREQTIRRKIIELFWAFQLEKRLSKHEILEIYLNESYFGHNVYGIEAASQFYFRHSARELTVAESALLVIQLANPARYSPIRHPARAKILQQQVLNQMVELNFISREEADLSFAVYWNETYDPLRSASETAYFIREDRAPYFSEFVRRELERILHGAHDYFRDGLIVHTTLDLRYQEKADLLMQEAFNTMNRTFLREANERTNFANREFIPIVEGLSLIFNIPAIRTAGTQQRNQAYREFYNSINPTLNAMSLMFGCQNLRHISRVANRNQAGQLQRTTIEGALVAIENETGRIKAMVGGSDFETKRFNRATQARVMTGSAFKPLYYSAALSSNTITLSTMLHDKPVVFINEDGTEYIPNNFLGRWRGVVSARYAMAHSLNIPSIHVLDMAGFDAAINRSARLLGIRSPEEITRMFPRNYPLALGTVSTDPMRMAQAYAVFPNQGKEVTPIAIRFIEDRNGKIILDPERDLIARQRREGERLQIMTPQAAYLMVDMLKSTVDFGSLAGRRRHVGGFPMPFAGKTGTTQNWSDAWTIGFSPYITTAVWFGFDMPGNSLGLNQTGAMAAGPVWAQFMRDIHINNPDLPPIDFRRPSGLVERTVCSVSGMLPSQFCNQGFRTELFVAGTEAKSFCTIHEFRSARDAELIRRLQDNYLLNPGVRSAPNTSIAPGTSSDTPSIQTLRSINERSRHTANEAIDRSLLD